MLTSQSFDIEQPRKRTFPPPIDWLAQYFQWTWLFLLHVSVLSPWAQLTAHHWVYHLWVWEWHLALTAKLVQGRYYKVSFKSKHSGQLFWHFLTIVNANDWCEGKIERQAIFQMDWGSALKTEAHCRKGERRHIKVRYPKHIHIKRD